MATLLRCFCSYAKNQTQAEFCYFSGMGFYGAQALLNSKSEEDAFWLLKAFLLHPKNENFTLFSDPGCKKFQKQCVNHNYYVQVFVPKFKKYIVSFRLF